MMPTGEPSCNGLSTGLDIGFVNHFPLIRHCDDQLSEVGANVVIMRAPWALMEPAEGQYDFAMLDEQLDFAWRQHLRIVVLLEAGPTHAGSVG